MDLDWKAARRRRGKAQRRDTFRHDVTFDVVAMQMDLQRFVRGETDDDLIVLANGQGSGFGGWPFAMNFELEHAIFRMNVCDRRSKHCDRQQRASEV